MCLSFSWWIDRRLLCLVDWQVFTLAGGLTGSSFSWWIVLHLRGFEVHHF